MAEQSHGAGLDKTSSRLSGIRNQIDLNLGSTKEIPSAINDERLSGHEPRPVAHQMQ